MSATNKQSGTNRNRPVSACAGNTRTKRSTSLVLLNRKVTPSAESFQEKILNIDRDQQQLFDRFFKVCHTFENILRNLQLTGNPGGLDVFCEKLTKIRLLIEKKISEAGAESVFGPGSSSVLSWDLSSSMTSLCSQNFSDADEDKSLALEAFMKEVNCPFCGEVQSDKTCFVKHLDKSCRSHLNKEMKKVQHFPYAAFQILPNNTFKCNICLKAVQQDLIKFYQHTQNAAHVRNFAKALEARTYETSLYCVSCRALVFNNYTQIKTHINHEVHKTNRANKKTSACFLNKGIRCIFTRGRKLKCLYCLPKTVVFTTPRGLLKHFEDPAHRTLNKSVTLMHCEVCSEDIQMHEVIKHFASSSHNANEEKLKEDDFHVCLFCDFHCETSLKLSSHMEECSQINILRKQISLEEAMTGFCLKDTGQRKEATKKRNSTVEKPRIIVKNCTEIPELFKYFRKFGEIVTMTSQNDEDVVVEFRDRSVVDDVLLLRGVLAVGGKKLNITTDSTRAQDDEEEEHDETASKSESSDDENFGRISNGEGEDDDDDDGGGGGPSAAKMIQDDQLEDMFGRVSKHLMNTSQKFTSTVEEIIKRDCIQALKVDECHLVGFSGCGVSLPAEFLNLFCGVEENLSGNAATSGSPFRHDDFALLSGSHMRLRNSELWKAGDSYTARGPHSYITCVHRETGRTCLITFWKSASILTSMLRECINKSNLVQPFCLIIRFWFSVHKLKIHNSEFVLISLLVFFLINVGVATLPEDKFNFPAVEVLLKATEFLEEPHPFQVKARPPANVKELFQRFLHFVDTFDFDKCAIYLPLRIPIPKTVLMESEFMIRSGLKNRLSFRKFDLCILDPISCVDLAEDIDDDDKKAFLNTVQDTVKHYQIK